MTNHIKAASRYFPSVDEREAAERRLCRFFQSFGIDALAEPERLIDPFIVRALQFWRPHSGLDLAVLALDEAEIELKTWFTVLLDLEDRDEGISLMKGRAAFLLSGGAACHASLFLVPVQDLPADFIEMMRDQAPSAVPPSIDGDMDHQPYEAWTLRHLVTKALPIERGMMQVVADLMRRDGGRLFGFPWRDTGPTP